MVFQIYPMLRGLWMAFTDYRFMKLNYEPFVGVGNFIEAFTDDMYFWQTFGRSLYFTAIYVLPMVFVALLCASIIGLVKHAKVSGFYRTIIYIPVILPVAVAMLMWREMFDPLYGFINHFIAGTLHMPQLRQKWLNDPKWTIPIVAIARIWKDMGFCTLLLIIGIYSINKELYEAAEIDGASALQQWRWITIPLLKPTLTIVLVLYGSIASAAENMMIMYQQTFGPENSALTLGYYYWVIAFRWGDMRMGYAAAMSLFLGVISMIIAATIFRVLRTERA